jgi:ubiquinone/menaquinone biosynthesis C-methylase UbiE
MPGYSVNYDQVAPTYNRRFSNQKDRPIAAALIELVRESGARRVLEVGCGTGRWLADLTGNQVTSPAGLFGLDRSIGMLAEASEQQLGLQIVQGLAESLPFPGQSFDLVYCVNALHHFSQPDQFICQAFHLLQPGGLLAIIGMDPRNFLEQFDRPARARWYVYEFFEGTLETDLLRFPSWGQILDWMTGAGFEFVNLQPVETVRDTKIGAAIWSDPFLEKNSTSQLILLSDEAYQTGLDKIRSVLAKTSMANQTINFPVDLLIDMLVARKSDG